MMTWHADDLLSAYRQRDLDESATASVDAHLLACAACRRALRAHDDPDAIEALWADIVDEIDARPSTVVERVLGRLGVPDWVGRVLAATPGLAVTTVVAAAVTLLFGVVLGDTDDAQQFATFVALAAVVPVVGVAVSFGVGVDPSYEVGAAAPMSGLRLVLVRAVAVGAIAVVFGLLGSFAHRDAGLVAVGWVLPSIGLSSAALALGTWVRPWRAGAVVAVAWLGGVAVAGDVTGDWLAPFGPPTQVLATLLAIVSAVVVAVRAPTLDHREI